MTMPRTRGRKALPAGLLVMGALALVQACATENVTQVIVESVAVQPADALMLEGDTVALDATVIDQNGVPLDGVAVSWSTSAPGVAFVDERGVVRAVSDGVATIEASFGDRTGAATVTVIPRTAIQLEPRSMPLFAGAGGAAPSAEQVRIENRGAGTLTGLSAEVRHDGPAEWLDVVLSGTATPATLTLTTNIEDMPAGRYTATVALTSDDPEAGESPLQVTLSLTSFTVAEEGDGTTVSESGSTDTFTAVLDLQPTSDVVLVVTSADAGEVEVSPASLTFTPSDWSTPQTVTVTGVEDTAADGDQMVEVTVAVDGDASGPAWAPALARVVQVEVEDDDQAGLNIEETPSRVLTDEGGKTGDFDVSLDTRPGSDVVVHVKSGDEGQLVVSPTTLTFTPSNWNTLQRVTTTAVDDLVVDGDRMVSVTLSVEADPGSGYEAVEDRVVRVRARDNDDDDAGLVVVETGGSTSATEGGPADAVTVALTGQPLTDVVVDVSVDDPSDATATPSRLTFAPSAWDTPQTVNLSAVDDVVVDGDRERTITFAVDGSASASAFRGATATVTMTTVDNDVAGFTVTAGRGSAREGGPPDTLHVVLSARPASDVVITVASDNPSDGAVAPGRITFTPDEWNVRRPVTFTAVDDGVPEWTPNVRTLTFAVDEAASDPAFAGVAPRTVTVSTLNRLFFGSAPGPSPPGG